MPYSSTQRARVRAVTAVPGAVVKRIDDEVDALGGDRAQIERIKKTIGLDERRVAAAGTTAADLCRAAAEAVFAGSSLGPGQVDALVCVTQTPDHFQPANAALLHGWLGLEKDCAALDVNLGCSGYVYGLWLGHLMVEAGGCQNVLLLAGDTLSHCVNPGDRAVAPLFGDAGSATWIARVSGPGEGGETGGGAGGESAAEAHFGLHTDGSGAGAITVPAGGFRRPAGRGETFPEETDADGNTRCGLDLRMDGAEVFNFTLREVPPAVEGLLAAAGRGVEEVDTFVFHQANRYLLSNISRRLKLPPEKVPADTVSRFGNQSCASIPATLCDALGERLVAGRVRALLCGYGVGLSWAAALLDLNNLEICSTAPYGPPTLDP